MSHLAVRLVADWLDDADEGVNAIAALVPRDGGDPAPGVVSVYDETRDPVAALSAPHEEDGITYPAILVSLQQGDFAEDQAETDAGAVHVGSMVAGTVSVVVELVIREADAEDALAESMYQLRAIRGSLIRFNQPAAASARERDGIRLLPGTVRFGRPDVKREGLQTVGAVIVTYPVWETIPS